MSRPALLAFLSPVALLALAGCPAPVHPYEVRACHTDIHFEAPADLVTEPRVAGEWNGFAAQPMEKTGERTWRLRVELEPRAYAYELVDAVPSASPGPVLTRDPKNPYTRWVGGKEYSRLKVEDCGEPIVRLEHFRNANDGTVALRAQYVDGSEAAGPGEVKVTLDGAEVPNAFDPATGAIRVALSDIAHGKHELRVTAKDASGREAKLHYLPFWIEDEPFDWQEAILYFAFTDRFRNGDPTNDAPVGGVDPMVDYRGGDFAGIRMAIEEGYFDALGVRAIWISPVDQNPDGHFAGSNNQRYTGYHGYWPSAPRTTQKRFGTLEELRAMTDAAHARGIRVITDLVINHTHQEHPWFAEHKEEGWYNVSNACTCGSNGCDWDARRLDCWFTPYLPDLNWRNTALVDQMIGDALWWVREAGLDGFRLDAVKHLDHVAGRTLAAELNAITNTTGTPFYLVGETFTGSDGRALIAEYISPDELHGQFDFPLYWPLLDAFGRGGSLQQVDDAVKQNEAFYAPFALNSPFLGNHDVARFISYAAGHIRGDSSPESQAWSPNKPPPSVDADEPFRRLRDGLTFVLTLPGVPLIYYGDEVGLPGAGDPDNRRMMKWGSELSPRERALLEHVQKVGQARRAHRPLRFGARYTLLAGQDTLVYQRDDAATGQGALVTVNRAGNEAPLSLPLRGRLAAAEGAILTDVISGRTATVSGGRVSLTLPARASGVWVQVP